MMVDKKRKVPNLRFKGFTDPWVQRKAKDLFIPVNERNREDLPVLSVTQDQGVVFRNNLAIDIKYDESTLSSYKVIHPGDFVISLRSFQGGFELSNVLGISSPAYTIFDFAVPAEQDKLYWKTIFKTFKFIESLKTVTFGIRDGKSISFKEFGDLKLNYPSDVDEQRRIGEFFAKLDETIAANQRKLDLLKEQKKGYLQKMFPKNGAKVPELRFAGFADDWEERKLGDAVSISSGVTGDATLQDGEYRLTRIESISQGMLNVARLGFTNEKPDQKYLLNLGDILYSNINSLSHIGKVALVDTAGIYHGINLLRFQMRNDVDSEFLFQRLNTMPMKSWAVSHANPAVSQASINQTELSKQPISSPTITEQQKIGSFFKQLDDTIDLQHQKLAKYQSVKKSLLQQMFI